MGKLNKNNGIHSTDNNMLQVMSHLAKIGYCYKFKTPFSFH